MLENPPVATDGRDMTRIKITFVFVYFYKEAFKKKKKKVKMILVFPEALCSPNIIVKW